MLDAGFPSRDVLWFVCQCIPWALQKQLNWSRCHFRGPDLHVLKEMCYIGALDPLMTTGSLGVTCTRCALDNGLVFFCAWWMRPVARIRGITLGQCRLLLSLLQQLVIIIISTSGPPISLVHRGSVPQQLEEEDWSETSWSWLLLSTMITNGWSMELWSLPDRQNVVIAEKVSPYIWTCLFLTFEECSVDCWQMLLLDIHIFMYLYVGYLLCTGR